MHRIVAAGTLLCVCILALCGCAQHDAADPDRPITVVFWQFWQPEIVRPVLDRFEFEHPGIRVELRQLDWFSGLEEIEAAIGDGAPPDLCELGCRWLPRLAAAGALVDLTGKPGTLDSGLRLWETVSLDERIYGYPWLVASRALLFHRGLLREAGVDPEHPPETWDALLDAASRVDSLGPGRHGFGINAGERHILTKKFLPFAAGNGAGILHGNLATPAVSDTAMVEALEFYVQLGETALRAEQSELDRAFAGGSLAMQVAGAWTYHALTTARPELDVGVARIPKPSPYAGRHATFADVQVLAALSDSRHREAAIQLALFLIKRDNAVRLCRAASSVQPAARGDADHLPDSTQWQEPLFFELVDEAVAPPAHLDWIAFEDIMNTAIDDALENHVESSAALDDAARRMQQVLDAVSERR